MAKKQGLQYRLDRASQSIAPQRKLDAFGLRHPALDRAALVVCGLIIGAAVYTWTNSVLWAVVGLVVGTPLLWWRVRANHQRRLANGTTAQNGPPSP